MSSTATDVIVALHEADINPDDPVKAHIVSCPDDKPSSEAWITEARVLGLEVEAICGHRWIPERNPERHPICDACLLEAKRRVEAGE